MNSMILRWKFLIPVSIIYFIFVSSNVTIFSQEVHKISYVPLVYNVPFPPTPLKGEGGIHLIYELHMTNFYRGEINLYRWIKSITFDSSLILFIGIVSLLPS